MEEKIIKGVVIHDSHGNVVDEAPIYPQGTEELVTQHNADPDAHPAIREAIVGLRTKVERRLVGAKVTFNDGHTEDVELGLNDQGEVILLLPKETFGKIDGVKVNGEELKVDENGKVDITIPQSVSDLEDADAYATKEEAQAMVDEAKVTGASVDYQEDGGSPSASVDFSEGSLGFKLKNMKMKFSELEPEEKEELRGPQGIPGESAIWTGEGEEIMTLAQETGNSIGKGMSQKAVTNELYENAQIIGETEEDEFVLRPYWYQGSLSVADGTNVEALMTIRTGFVFAGDDKIVLECNDGYFVKSVICYDSESTGSFSGVTYFGNKSGSGFDKSVSRYEFWGEGKHYRCTFGRVDDANLNTNEATNISIKAVEIVTKGLGSKVTFNDVANKVSEKPIPPIDDYYGYVSGGFGTTVSSQAPTVYSRIFNVADTNCIYYADLRVFPTSSVACGVAYFDSGNKFICGEYIGESREISLKKAELHVPSNTRYIHILGCDNADTNGYVIPTLYVENSIENATYKRHHNEHLREIANFTLVGKGDNLVETSMLNIKGGRPYVIKMSYDTWTIPNPEASTYALESVEFLSLSGSPLANNAMLQNSFELKQEYKIVTRLKAAFLTIGIRASVGENINFSVYEVVEDIDFKEKGFPVANKILYNITKVNKAIFENVGNAIAAVQGEMVDSAWAVMFPNSYTANGRPSQVLAMLHGANGYVTPNVMGYNLSQWIAWRNAYLSAGFVVLEINGYGISEQSDAKSLHWGCPAALETLDKAFMTLKDKYNVSEKMIIHGSSMGGSTAWSYALTYPSKVLALGLFAPATLSWIMLTRKAAHAIIPWYDDIESAEEDNFQRIVGYDPILQALRYKDGVFTPEENLTDYDVFQYEAQSEYVLVGQPLPFPVRIWHGTSDATVPISLSEIVVAAYRRGGQNVTLRKCPNKPHDMCTGTVQYVVDESVEYFKRYSE